MPPNMIGAQRLHLTADKSELVADGDIRAAFLYATPGDEIPASAAEKFGLVDGALPDFDAAAAPAAPAKKRAPATKPKKAAETKPKTATETKGA